MLVVFEKKGRDYILWMDVWARSWGPCPTAGLDVQDIKASPVQMLSSDHVREEANRLDGWKPRLRKNGLSFQCTTRLMFYGFHRQGSKPKKVLANRFFLLVFVVILLVFRSKSCARVGHDPRRLSPKTLRGPKTPPKSAPKKST